MQLNLNGHYCLATKEHYEKFVEDNMRDCFLYVKHFEVNDVFIVENGKAYLKDISLAEGLIPMHLHNKEWVKGSLEHGKVYTKDGLLDYEAYAQTRRRSKPVERISVEKAHSRIISSVWCPKTTREEMNKIADYVEYLEANQKATK